MIKRKDSFMVRNQKKSSDYIANNVIGGKYSSAAQTEQLAK